MPPFTSSGPLTSLIRSRDGISRFLAESVSRGSHTPAPLTDWNPAVDIFESDDGLTLKADLPGINPKDIELRVQNNTVTLGGERKYDTEFKQENVLRIERYYGRFTRTFTLPSAVKLEAIEAEYRNGVLTIWLPALEKAGPKQIKIAVGKEN